MVFKTLMKRQCRMVPSGTVRFHKLGRVIISWDLRRKIKKDFNYLEILIDEDYNKFALKPSKDNIRGWRLNSSNMIQCSPLRKACLEGDFKARFTEGKIIIDEIKLSNDLVAMEFWEDEK